MRRKVRFSYRTVVLLPLDFWHSAGVNNHDGIPCRPRDGKQLTHQTLFIKLPHYVFFMT
jgi:hypothetical protein